MRRALACLVLVAACGGSGTTDAQPPEPSGSTPSTTPAATPTLSTPADPSGTSSPPAPEGTRIVVDESEFGPMLFDARGQAIYLFDVETTSEPACYDDCAVAWPPVLTEGEPVAGRGVRRGLLGTVERRDGSLQVTYGGHPLYFYAHEEPGEVECHDVFLNGGTWFVVQPDGTPA